MLNNQILILNLTLQTLTHPLWVLLQLIEDSVVAELENEMQLPLPSKHLDQVHQVRVLQVLQHSAIEGDDSAHDQ